MANSKDLKRQMEKSDNISEFSENLDVRVDRRKFIKTVDAFGSYVVKHYPAAVFLECVGLAFNAVKYR